MIVPLTTKVLVVLCARRRTKSARKLDVSQDDIDKNPESGTEIGPLAWNSMEEGANHRSKDSVRPSS